MFSIYFHACINKFHSIKCKHPAKFLFTRGCINFLATLVSVNSTKANTLHAFLRKTHNCERPQCLRIINGKTACVWALVRWAEYEFTFFFINLFYVRTHFKPTVSYRWTMFKHDGGIQTFIIAQSDLQRGIKGFRLILIRKNVLFGIWIEKW